MVVILLIGIPLETFIENGKVPITLRTEKITQLSYGEEKVEVIVDTIGFMPAKDRIFKKNYNMNASTNGIFQGFLTKVGDLCSQGFTRLQIKSRRPTENRSLYFHGTRQRCEFGQSETW